MNKSGLSKSEVKRLYWKNQSPEKRSANARRAAKALHANMSKEYKAKMIKRLVSARKKMRLKKLSTSDSLHIQS